VYDKNHDPVQAGHLDATVERLTSEVLALSHEVASLTRAVHDIQSQQLGRRLRWDAPPVFDTARRSNAPAIVIVAIAAVLLSWQVMMSPLAGEREAERPAVLRARMPSLALAVGAMPAADESRAVPRTPIVYRGALSVAADQPSAEVFVNRKRVGVAPVRVNNLRAGSHLVWIESEGHRRWTRVVTVPYERVTRVKADLEPVDMQ
jgi:hypothetical protein